MLILQSLELVTNYYFFLFPHASFPSLCPYSPQHIAILGWLYCLSKLSHEALPCSLFVCVIPSPRPLSHICKSMCVHVLVCATSSVFGALNSVHGWWVWCARVRVFVCICVYVCMCCNQCVIPSLRPLFHTAGLREPLESFCAIQASFALST